MIYEPLDDTDPIRQGDIFVDLPRVDISMARVMRVDEDGIGDAQSWESISQDSLSAVLPIKRVPGIVISQDCDNERAPDISFCEVAAFKIVEPRAAQTVKPGKWMSLITQHARINLKWFYLPPEAGLFADKMAVDFRSVFRLSSDDVRNYINLRKKRLQKVARAHFRERLAEFFRRYPYDEWYPLNKEEFDQYRNEKGSDVKAFPWQESD